MITEHALEFVDLVPKSSYERDIGIFVNGGFVDNIFGSVSISQRT